MPTAVVSSSNLHGGLFGKSSTLLSATSGWELHCTAVTTRAHYDWIIVGSGFGGSVSALRLAEKGYSVLVIEKGLRFKPEDFAKNNKDLKRWYWLPKLGMKGIFQMSFFDHMTVVHGVGVGGGSLTYACTLPTPGDPFFESPSWSGLADWKEQLAPHYQTALRMLGATVNQTDVPADRMLKEVAKGLGSRSALQKDACIHFLRRCRPTRARPLL